MGRDRSNETRSEHFTKLVRSTMQTAAWRSLTPYGQALYPWLKLEWHGPKANNNGQIQLSTRQAAEAMGINTKTAAKAFRELQARGFIVMTKPARLGLGGQATSPSWEITEIAMPNADPHRPRNLFREWKDGHDFPVHRAEPQNRLGINGQAKVVKMKAVN